MQGGGIPEDSLEQVFHYGYTTVDDGELSSRVPPHAAAIALSTPATCTVLFCSVMCALHGHI